jgi:putative aldouronate transport system permease protein
VEQIVELQEIAPPAQTLKSAMIIVSTVPILVVYPFIQRYFVKGALVGAVKG